MQALRIMIVEDEPVIAEEIAATIEDLGYVTAAKVLHAKEVLNTFRSSVPDLVLMDINLGAGKDGIHLAAELKAEKNVPLIFLTSYSDKTIVDRAKAINPDGYIVKPFDEKDLQVAIEIAFHRFEHQHKNSTTEKTDSFLVNKHLFVRHKNKLVKLNPEDVLFAEAQSNYTVIVTDKEKYTVSTTLGIIEERLIQFGFFRIHRSYIINLAKIETIEDDTVTIGRQALPLSRNNKQGLLNKITQL
jgi:DNA-binding LytR/AlgR family response regulator